ncbi:MAG: N-acetyltransferase [Acidimicrobiales bacterium]|jgi:putative acetyltransferase
MARASKRTDPSHDLPAGLKIRVETRADYAAVSAVVFAAFGSEQEPKLVEAIRDSAGFVPNLSLVAEVGGAIVGHVMISYATIKDGDAEARVALLAPLAVVPGFHGRGVGSALVRRVSELADELAEPVVVLEGNPVFYGRLGFEYSVPYGIHLPIASWAPPEAAQVLRLGNYTPSIRGEVLYPSLFNEVTGD